MTKCLNCGGTDIVKGKISRTGDEFFSDIIFKPEGLRFLATTLTHGTKFNLESLACLGCGLVWTHTDPKALREFVTKYCKKS
jgi:hypothetical protein